MDYAKLVKTLYEMGECVVSEGASNYSSDNNPKVIEKADEYEQAIEIVFHDDSRLWFSKFGIKDIAYSESADYIKVEFYNKESLVFEKY